MHKRENLNGVYVTKPTDNYKLFQILVNYLYIHSNGTFTTRTNSNKLFK